MTLFSFFFGQMERVTVTGNLTLDHVIVGLLNNVVIQKGARLNIYNSTQLKAGFGGGIMLEGNASVHFDTTTNHGAGFGIFVGKSYDQVSLTVAMYSVYVCSKLFWKLVHSAL